jgi:hypothetical protein
MVARVNTVKRPSGQCHCYRKVLCGTYNRTGGPTCSYNAVDADALTRAVVTKLQTQLFNPAAMEALKKEIRRQAEAAPAANGHLDALEARLATLERSVERAARRVVDEEDDDLVPALRKQLKVVTAERDELARQVDAIRRSDQPAEDVEEVIAEALGLAGKLEEVLLSAAGDQLRAVLGEAVSSVELFFDHAPTRSGKRTRSRFARGLVYLRPQRFTEYIQVNGSPAPCRNTTKG